MEFQLETADKQTVTLSEMTRGQKSLVVFLRHLG